MLYVALPIYPLHYPKLPHSKTVKNTKKLSVFGKNDSRRLSNFLRTHIFWKFDYISRTYNQINYRNIWFAKVTTLIMMTEVFFFFGIFVEKGRTWIPLSNMEIFAKKFWQFLAVKYFRKRLHIWCLTGLLTVKRLWSCRFSKIVSSKDRKKPWFFVT